MDLCLYGKNTNIPAADLAPVAGMDEKQVQRVYAMIESKRAITRYLRSAPLLVEEVHGIE
jgi:NAD+ synthase